MRAIDFTKKFMQENGKLLKQLPLVWIGLRDSIFPFEEDNSTANLGSNCILINFAFNKNQEVIYDINYVKLSEIDKFTEIDKNISIDWEHSNIDLFIPDIFDYRLIPKDFMNVKVNWMSSYCGFPEIENCNSPKEYREFVDKYFEEIALKLEFKNTNKQELLDALTGGFEDLKKEQINRIKEIIDGM